MDGILEHVQPRAQNLLRIVVLVSASWKPETLSLHVAANHLRLGKLSTWFQLGATSFELVLLRP